VAEQHTRRNQNGSGRISRGRLSAREAVERVRRDLPELLGHPVESVLGVEPEADNGWSVTVQVVEIGRIPPTTDVLAIYDVTLNRHGELLRYKRKRRYYRNQADED
jgi:hypothetical protein